MNNRELHLIRLSRKKAAQSICGHKICAIGLNRKGDVLGMSTNKPGFKNKKGCGKHAETELISRYGRNLKTILILRVSHAGLNLSPIHACAACQKMADNYGIKIKSLSNEGMENERKDF